MHTAPKILIRPWLRIEVCCCVESRAVYSADADADLCILRTLCRHVTLVHQWSFFCCFDCRHWSTKTVPTVYQSSKIVKNSQKTVKTAKMTIGVPIVTCLHRVRRIHKAESRTCVSWIGRHLLTHTVTPAQWRRKQFKS